MMAAVDDPKTLGRERPSFADLAETDEFKPQRTDGECAS